MINYLVEDELPVRNVLVDSVMQYHKECTNRGAEALRYSPFGIEGIFYTYGDYRAWSYWNNNDIQARFDIAQYIGKIYEFKIGVHYIDYDIKLYNNPLAWVTDPFWEYFEGTPYKLSCYLDNKIDLKRVVAHLGMRYDYFNPNTESPDTTISTGPTYKISPRIGIVVPINNRMKIRFNYGHYSKLYYYSLLHPIQNIVMYEFAAETQFFKNMTFGLSAYYKRTHDFQYVTTDQFDYALYYDYQWFDRSDVKGLAFKLQKRMSTMWAFGLSYNLRFSEGIYEWNQPPDIDTVIKQWLDFDERGIIHANFDSEFPNTFFFLPLRDFTNSFIISYHSGLPYTPEDFAGNQLGDVNSARMPGFWNIDWKFSRYIRIGSAKLALTGLINNLLNTKQITDVYNTTGSPDEHGYPDPLLSQFGSISIISSRYSPQADHDHNGLITPVEMRDEYIAARDDLYEDPTNWKNPFRLRIGIGIEF